MRAPQREHVGVVVLAAHLGLIFWLRLGSCMPLFWLKELGYQIKAAREKLGWAKID
jgi:hypothetical protein